VTAARWDGVVARLKAAGWSLSDVAGLLGITQSAVSQVAKRPSPRVQAAIARILGVSPASLWPERYDADGLPVDRRRIARKEAA
jgi:Ner family transcriptional regulator